LVKAVSDSDRLDHALDLLSADRSPRQEAPALSQRELSMLLFAQLLRGTKTPPPRPEFIAALLNLLFPDEETRKRIGRLSAAHHGAEPTP
jgi:hypothetical protein